MRSWMLVAGLLLLACDRAAVETAPEQAPSAPSSATLVLDVVPVTEQKVDATVRLPGELSPYERVAIYPRVNGFLEAIHVDRGSRVGKGQLLARLSAPELVAQRAEAESKAIATKSTFERLKAAASTPGAVAKHDLELAEAALQADQARVKSIRTMEGYLDVRAPFDGVVTERNVHPGALLGPPAGAMSTPMLIIEQVKRLRLTIAVPETDFGGIAEGAQALFMVRAWPGQKMAGSVRRVSHSVEAKTRTMPVELDVDNSAGKLASGMYADVLWPVRRSSASLLVPASAIVQTTERTCVDRIRSGTLEQVIVQRGATVGDKTEVFGDLKAGDLVLRRGSEERKTGAHVETRLWTPDGGAH